MRNSKEAHHIILIKDGELLPIQKNSPCLRMGSIAKSLVERGNKVTWLATSWSHQFKAKIEDAGRYEVQKNYDVHLLECGSYTKNISFSRISHHCNFARRTGAWLENLKNKPDLVVCAFPIPSVSAIASEYCKQNSIPFVLDVRDLWPDVFLDKLGKFASVFASPLIASQRRDLEVSLKNSDAVIAVSQGYLSWAKSHWKKVVPNHDEYEKSFLYFPIGAERIDKSTTKPSFELAEILSEHQDKTCFSFLGSFGKSYDLDLIVSAAEHYEKIGADDVHFLIAGDGEQRLLIEDGAHRLSNLTYCGWLDANNTRAFLSASHVGIMPLQSVTGTFPNKPFQYMASDLPIISSLVGDFATFLEEEEIGYNFKQGDLFSFINCIERLRGKEQYLKMSQRVQNIFEERFEQETVYSQFADVLEDLLEKETAI